MKTRLSLIIILTIVTLGMAATLVIDIPGSPSDPNSDVSRTSRSFGILYQLGHDANMNEVNYYVRQWIISQTKLGEQVTYRNNYVEKPMDMQPTPTPTPTATP
jgi:hypothetical protein